MRQKLRRRLKMMAVIRRTDFIQGQFAFEPKKILVHNPGQTRLTQAKKGKAYYYKKFNKHW